MATETATEKQLRMLIQKARRTVADATVDPCREWIKREVAQMKKLQDQIERLQKSPDVSSALFNEARDANDQLNVWINQLESHSTGKPINALPDVTDRTAFNRNIITDADIYNEYHCPF